MESKAICQVVTASETSYGTVLRSLSGSTPVQGIIGLTLNADTYYS